MYILYGLFDVFIYVLFGAVFVYFCKNPYFYKWKRMARLVSASDFKKVNL